MGAGQCQHPFILPCLGSADAQGLCKSAQAGMKGQNRGSFVKKVAIKKGPWQWHPPPRGFSRKKTLKFVGEGKSPPVKFPFSRWKSSPGEGMESLLLQNPLGVVHKSWGVGVEEPPFQCSPLGEISAFWSNHQLEHEGR